MVVLYNREILSRLGFSSAAFRQVFAINWDFTVIYWLCLTW
jgi:hypothetical protein